MIAASGQDDDPQLRGHREDLADQAGAAADGLDAHAEVGRHRRNTAHVMLLMHDMPHYITFPPSTRCFLAIILSHIAKHSSRYYHCARNHIECVL